MQFQFVQASLVIFSFIFIIFYCKSILQRFSILRMGMRKCNRWQVVWGWVVWRVKNSSSGGNFSYHSDFKLGFKCLKEQIKKRMYKLQTNPIFKIRLNSALRRLTRISKFKCCVQFVSRSSTIHCSFMVSISRMGGRHSSVVSSAPTNLQPRVQIPRTPSMLFFNLYYWNCIEKITKINKTRPGLAHFLFLFKKSISRMVPNNCLF